ncbi:hypothetical protein C3L33_21447, partial [Rhododendron williamsianum]
MSTPRQTSSSSITSADELRYTGMDERRRKRLISNRDSARRSRMRKQKTMEDFANAVTRLKSENNGLVGKIDKAAGEDQYGFRHSGLESPVELSLAFPFPI